AVPAAPDAVNVSGFHGCIRKLYINHELQDFTRSHMGAGVEPGCQACRQSYCAHGTIWVLTGSPAQGPRCHCHPGWVGPRCDRPATAEGVTVATGVDPCADSRCVQGACVPVDARTYRCDCRDGYEGALCHLQRHRPAGAAACPHGEGGRCACEDGFSGQSCDIELPCGGQPVRDHHRLRRGSALCQTAKPFSWVECRGRFQCDDGTTFTQDVEKPVECGCKECV
uniref:EGF-like domain-containing protein n=1 Tax=Tetraodon nigroviridis TaxID=99883 RepID=H3C8X9_TETNG